MQLSLSLSPATVKGARGRERGLLTDPQGREIDQEAARTTTTSSSTTTTTRCRKRDEGCRELFQSHFLFFTSFLSSKLDPQTLRSLGASAQCSALCQSNPAPSFQGACTIQAPTMHTQLIHASTLFPFRFQTLLLNFGIRNRVPAHSLPPLLLRLPPLLYCSLRKRWSSGSTQSDDDSRAKSSVLSSLLLS